MVDITKYKESAQLSRSIAIIRCLFGHSAHGLSTGEIAKATGESQTRITVLIAQLAVLGVVQQTRDEKKWRLGAFMVQGALAHQRDMQLAEADLTETKQRYNRIGG